MTRREGWRTATVRSSGNDSSLWRYRIGAKSLASVASESFCARESGSAGGSSGKWVRGPQAVSRTLMPITSSNTPHEYGVLSRSDRVRPCGRGHSIVSCSRGDLLRLWRGSCESHVRPRTILRKRCSSSRTIAPALHSAVRRAPGGSFAIPIRFPPSRAPTSRSTVRVAAASPAISPAPPEHANRLGKSYSATGSCQQLAGLAQIMRYDLVTIEIICLDFGTFSIARSSPASA